MYKLGELIELYQEKDWKGTLCLHDSKGFQLDEAAMLAAVASKCHGRAGGLLPAMSHLSPDEKGVTVPLTCGSREGRLDW